MNAPSPSSASQSVANTPVSQSARTNSGGHSVVPIVIPVPQGSGVMPSLSEDREEKINRNVIIDVFSKGVKVEVYRG